VSTNIICSELCVRTYCRDIASIFHSHVSHIEQYLSIALVFRYHIFDLLFVLKEHIYDA